MQDRPVSRRGVYYDLSLSPYGYETPYGDIFKFPSQKKLDMYTRDVEKKLETIEKLIDKHELRRFIPDGTHHMLRRAVYQSMYNRLMQPEV